MVDVTFHIRSSFYYAAGGGAPTTEPAYWESTTNAYGDSIYKTNVYDISQEIFVATRVSPAFTNKEIYINNRVDSVRTYSPSTYPRNSAFGDIDLDEADYLNICWAKLDTGSAYNSGTGEFTNSNWVAGGWSNPSTAFATFQSEMTNYLAQNIVYSRTFESPTNAPSSNYADWNLHFYVNQVVGEGDVTIVIFYPGNDPEATSTVTETI